MIYTQIESLQQKSCANIKKDYSAGAMTPENIKDWLRSINRDRFWLAGKLARTKKTVDGWLSAGKTIPSPVEESILRLMESAEKPPVDDPFHVTFTASEFEEIEEARQLAGYKSREDFYRDVIVEAAVNARKIEQMRGEHYPDHEIPLAKVAEEPPIYEVQETAIPTRKKQAILDPAMTALGYTKTKNPKIKKN